MCVCVCVLENDAAASEQKSKEIRTAHRRQNIAESREQTEYSREQRAESRGQRAEGREQRLESRQEIVSQKSKNLMLLMSLILMKLLISKHFILKSKAIQTFDDMYQVNRKFGEVQMAINNLHARGMYMCVCVCVCVGVFVCVCVCVCYSIKQPSRARGMLENCGRFVYAICFD
jgi:hypothetical protein